VIATGSGYQVHCGDQTVEVGRAPAELAAVLRTGSVLAAAR
jgi:hypothetical protein